MSGIEKGILSYPRGLEPPWTEACGFRKVNSRTSSTKQGTQGRKEKTIRVALSRTEKQLRSDSPIVI